MTFKKPESDEVVIERLLKEFGTGWFTAQMAKVRRDYLKEMVARGLLDCSKTPYGPLNYKVIVKK